MMISVHVFFIVFFVSIYEVANQIMRFIITLFAVTISLSDYTYHLESEHRVEYEQFLNKHKLQGISSKRSVFLGVQVVSCNT